MTTTYGLLCTKCGDDTECTPSLAGMPHESAMELVSGWLCADCLDEQDAAEADRAAERNREALADLTTPERVAAAEAMAAEGNKAALATTRTRPNSMRRLTAT